MRTKEEEVREEVIRPEKQPPITTCAVLALMSESSWIGLPVSSEPEFCVQLQIFTNDEVYKVS